MTAAKEPGRTAGAIARRRRLGVRGRLFAISLALLSVVGLVSGLVLESQLRVLLLRQAESTLQQHVSTVKHALAFAVSASPHDVEALRRLVHDLGHTTGTRVSLFDNTGALIADSVLDAEGRASAPPQDTLPEVESARLRGRGLAQRRSPELRDDALFAAESLPLSDGAGVVRAALPLGGIERTLGHVRVLLLGAGLFGMLLAALMTAFASHTLSRAFREVVDKAHALLSRRLARQIDGHGGDEIGVLAMSLDRLAEETERLVSELAAERDRMAAILDGMKDGVLAVDRDGRVAMLNRAARAMLGAREPGRHAPVEEAVPLPRVVELVHDAMAGRTHTEEVEVTGPPERVLTVHTAVPRQGGGAIVVIWDVTALRRLERVRRDFVANVSHELRTPVSIVSANAELLLDTFLTDPVARRLGEAMLRSADRMGRLVDDLLTLARIESGKYHLTPRPEPAAEAIGDAIRTVSPRAADRDVTIEGDAAPDLGLLADRRALDHALVNLLENAIKYGRSQGHVWVSAQRVGDAVRITVRDDGPGISPQHRSRVFERFYRVDKGRARDEGGTGLGLSIARHLVESQGGRVGVEAAEPRGSVFWIELPAAPLPGPEEDPAASRAPRWPPAPLETSA